MHQCRNLQDVKDHYHDLPHMAPNAIKFLNEYLTKDMVVFEWGAGGSTTWIAKRVKHIYSVENNTNWYKFLIDKVKELELINVTLYNRPTEKDLPATEKEESDE